MLRSDIQFHWHNRGFARFDDFLATLASRKRKDLRKERAAAQAEVDIIHLRGSDIRPEHWDAFWAFYQDTGARKWGTPYLTRAAFDLLGERMGEKILLVLALQDGEPVAGALNFIGGDALYGRYWGCTRDIRFLHFELCYYQAIEAAIDKMRLRANPPGFVLGKSRAEQWQPRHPHYDGPRPLSRIGSAGEKLFAPSTSDVILRDNSVSATTNARQNFLTLMAKPPPTAQVYHRVPSEAEKKHKLAQAGRSMATTQYRPRSSSTNVGRDGGGSKDAQIASLRAQLASARSQRR